MDMTARRSPSADIRDGRRERVLPRFPPRAARGAPRVRAEARAGVAEVLDAVAGLIGAGLAPPVALQVVSEVMAPRSPCAAVLARLLGSSWGSGLALDPAQALARAAVAPELGPEDRDGLRWAADVLAVAGPLGLPVRDLVAEVADVVRADRADRAEASAAAAGPRAGALVLSAMPAAALALGVLLGADPWAALVGTGVGRACLVLGTAAWAGGWWWIHRLVRGVTVRS